MAELTGAEAFMDATVQAAAGALRMSAAWNGGITDFPSWEVQDEVGKGTGYIGFSAGLWEIEVMVDSSSLALKARDLSGALLMVREWGGRFADLDETVEDLRGQVTQARARGDALSQVLGRIEREVGAVGYEATAPRLIVERVRTILAEASKDELEVPA